MVTPRIVSVLGGLHSRVAWKISGKQPQQPTDRSWAYPLLEEGMLVVGPEKTET